MKRKYLIITLLFLAIGFAAVSTTLLINGSTSISDSDDFRVYYSKTLVNGEENLYVVESDTVLSFFTELSNIGETYILEYDVTNSSRNYDAQLTMNCTGGNEYFSLTNIFDTNETLKALETRRGKLTVTLNKSYDGEYYAELFPVTCTIDAEPIERNDFAVGTVPEPVEFPCKWRHTDSDNDGEVSIGDEVRLCNDKFNIISISDEEIELLAAYSVEPVNNYLHIQTTSTNIEDYKSQFADYSEWNADDHYLQSEIYYLHEVNSYLYGYVSHLLELYQKDGISVNMITVEHLNKLGCTGIGEEHNDTTGTCENSPYKEWLLNGQDWWTKSLYTGNLQAYVISGNGNIQIHDIDNEFGTRPVISIDRDLLINLEGVDPQTFCSSQGYQYGMNHSSNYVQAYSSAPIVTYSIYFMCSNDENFETFCSYSNVGELNYCTESPQTFCESKGYTHSQIYPGFSGYPSSPYYLCLNREPEYEYDYDEVFTVTGGDYNGPGFG